MKLSLSSMLRATSLTLTAISINTYAQEVENNESRDIEIIQVTALKRLQDLQKAPVSVDVLSSEFVEHAQIRSVEDIANMTTGLTMDALPRSQPRPKIRGVGSSDVGAGSDQSTAVYIDNVYMSRPGLVSFDSFDVDRIEIVKGPQGTLWGKNVVGGLVHIVTKKPVEYTEAKVKATVGNEGILNASVMFNMPIIEDKLLSRVVIMSNHHDGFAKNELTGNELSDEDKISGRLHLLYNAADNLSIALSLSAIDENNSGPARTLLDGQVQDLSIDPDGNVRLTSGEIDGYDKRNVFSATTDINWSTNFADLEIIANHKTLDLSYLEDFDGTNMLQLAMSNNTSGDVLQLQRKGQEDTTSNSIEVRFSANENSDLFWQFGYFYEDTDIFQSNTDGIFSGLCFTDDAIGASGFYASGLASAVAGGLGFPSDIADQYGSAVAARCSDNDLISTPAATQVFNQYGKVESNAVFGEITYELNDRYSMTLGGRYSKDKKIFSVDTSDSILSFQLLANGYPYGFESVTAENEWSAFTYKVTVDGKLSSDTFGYATVSTGYKSGGFQNNPLSPEQALDSFDPENATNFELGIKTDIFDDKLRLNAAIFYQKLEDMQRRTVEGTISKTENSGRADMKGLELDTHYYATDNLVFDVKYTYLDAKFVDYIDGNKDYSGNYVSGAPKNSVSISAIYDIENPFNYDGNLNFTVNYNFKDKTFLDDKNAPPEILDKRSLVDARLVYSLSDWEVSIWIKNLTDEEYKTHYAQIYNSYATYGAPRTFGLSASWYYE
ncbi:MAG: TonB-dependent receptor [Colwellia sp.]|nr:TonB-dependent receptor [Colwellia sp.]